MLITRTHRAVLWFTLGGGVLLYGSGACGATLSPVERIATKTSSPHFTVNTVAVSDGTILDELVINGPPSPPPGFEAARQTVSFQALAGASNVKTLTVPAFNWVFGCSAVSGAMIAGYYDRTGYPSMYTGRTNGGVMPLDNSSWPTWSDGDATYPSCPLIASRNGVDGRTSAGSIDDYWIHYGSTADDPYITGAWTQHAWGDAIGDYMMTSQSAFDNSDGSTTFYTWVGSADQLTCDDMVSYSLFDGTLGIKQFYVAKGYTVTDCYNQKTDNTISGGFSFDQFKAEIDAGHPVMLHLAGHTIVGVGYDDATNTVYIHDTWDYDTHSMTWGDSYSGMALQSVSIVHLVSSAANSVTLTPSVASPASAGTPVTFTAAASGGSGAYEYKYLLKVPGGTLTTVRDYSTTATWDWTTTGLAIGTYQVVVHARNTGSTKSYETYKSINYVLQNAPATSVTLTPGVASPATAGTPVTFTAAASGGSVGSYEYKYLLKVPGGTLTTVRDYSSTATWDWTTTGLAIGTYQVVVHARNSGSTKSYETYKSIGYALK